jgi:ubiquinone/menaquinone biosynthesis C-methylase UbiE
VLDTPRVQAKALYVYTLLSEGLFLRENISYIHADLRENVFRDDFFDTMVCISTIEHIGLDNTQRDYTTDARYREDKPEDYQLVMREFYRTLKTGGRLLLTVPYGKRVVFDWLQQYDAAELQKLIAAFPGRLVEETYYRYLPTGWQFATAAECADCEYYNIHQRQGFDADYAAAARAVACLMFEK